MKTPADKTETAKDPTKAPINADADEVAASVQREVDDMVDKAESRATDDVAPIPFPRRRLMMSVQIAADSPGGVARCLLELINWIEAVERRAPGIDRDLGEQSHADGDRTRSFSAELDDQVQITHDVYEQALARWEEAQG